LTIAQNCKTYNNKTINCIDKDSLKQGFWIENITSKIFAKDSVKPNSRVNSLTIYEWGINNRIAEGFYKDNKRVGEWTFHKGSFYQDNYANQTYHEQKAFYTDSSYFRIVDTFWNFYATVSNDTTKLDGILYLKNDTLIVKCKDGNCNLKDPFKKYKKQTFPIRDLDDRLIWYNFRGYKEHIE
jgi:hypothetical protein